MDTGRFTNWAVGHRPLPPRRGVCIIDGSVDPERRRMAKKFGGEVGVTSDANQLVPRASAVGLNS
jgi:hypothetical protein